jgi:hypothetical protein
MNPCSTSRPGRFAFALLLTSACTPSVPAGLPFDAGLRPDRAVDGTSRGGPDPAAGSGGAGGNAQPPMAGAGPGAPSVPPPTAGTGADGPGAPPPLADGGASADGPSPPPPGPPPAPPGGPIPLPLVVTDHFVSRGWFGDGTIAAHFSGGMIIREVPSTTGPCAARPPGARGACLEVRYTPPPGFTPPPVGAFVGVYMLPFLRMAHPEANPPAAIGEPNWGLEPGVPVARGARRVSFFAASPQNGVRVSFRAGTGADNVVLPETTEILTPDWRPISMFLAGGDPGGRLLGGFAWTLKDTGRPAIFYLDGIVWDAEGSDPPPAPAGQRDGARRVVVINQCQETVWVAIGSSMAVPAGGGFQLDAGQTRTLDFPGGLWSGRLWGRTGCQFDGGGNGSCATGDCGGRLGCGVVGGKTPATLAEITFSASPATPDFYDISLVDGYNLPMAMAPLPGSFVRSQGGAFDCLAPTCVSDLNASCPADLRVLAGGRVVGCLSACERFGTDELCCRGAHATPETCAPSSFSRTFKAACPTAYSYAYDDPTSTFTCRGEDYAVWFCP